MTLLIVVFICGLLVPLLWAMVRGKDYWPFSHYPMFSRSSTLKELAVYRLALETKLGGTSWWRSEFFRYPEFVGQRLQRIHQAISQGGKDAVFANLEQQFLLTEVLRLIEAEEGTIDQYQAFRVVRRTIDNLNGDKPTIKDDTVARIPFHSLKRIDSAA